MIVTDQFVFIHFAKAGGSFVSSVLNDLNLDLKLFPDSHKHGGVNMIPLKHQGKPIVSCIRNPLELYISHYKFGYWKRSDAQMIDHQAAKQIKPIYPAVTFPEWYDLLHRVPGSVWAGNDKPDLHIHDAGWLRWLMAVTFTRDAVHAMTDDDHFKSYLDCVTWLRQETLGRDLAAFLEMHNITPPDDLATADRIYPIEGSTGQWRWEDYYTPALLSQVLERDAFIMRYFGYAND